MLLRLSAIEPCCYNQRKNTHHYHHHVDEDDNDNGDQHHHHSCCYYYLLGLSSKQTARVEVCEVVYQQQALTFVSFTFLPLGFRQRKNKKIAKDNKYNSATPSFGKSVNDFTTVIHLFPLQLEAKDLNSDHSLCQRKTVAISFIVRQEVGVTKVKGVFLYGSGTTCDQFTDRYSFSIAKLLPTLCVMQRNVAKTASSLKKFFFLLEHSTLRLQQQQQQQLYFIKGVAIKSSTTSVGLKKFLRVAIEESSDQQTEDKLETNSSEHSEMTQTPFLLNLVEKHYKELEQIQIHLLQKVKYKLQLKLKDLQ
ncbi:hypothetical protein FF38_06309 [Lucilia cuprina]|uniref:Uncharacterized protein n=1 Tax=Lucilia cuprina TaxID=7375 RepID=A0A0L0BVR1_LUCCU|nr:hypothetical protein FF38_06309 [Lucilia cuprina]